MAQHCFIYTIICHASRQAEKRIISKNLWCLWKFEVDFSVRSNNVHTKMTGTKQMMTVHHFNKYVRIDEDGTRNIVISLWHRHYVPQAVLCECFFFTSERSETVFAFFRNTSWASWSAYFPKLPILLPNLPNAAKIKADLILLD